MPLESYCTLQVEITLDLFKGLSPLRIWTLHIVPFIVEITLDLFKGLLHTYLSLQIKFCNIFTNI